MKKLNNFIDGKSLPAKSGTTSEIINPATGKAYATAPISGAADVDSALSAASKAFVEWRETTPAERQRALIKIADALEARSDELIAIEVENTGKPISLTTSEEVPPMLDQIRFFAGAALHIEGKSAGEYMRGMTSFIRREPIGVCAQSNTVELPNDDGCLEMGTCNRCWKYSGA
jgi:betaine-aldehyde dehydrogenase